ncbi:NAD(P)H-quinone oxidoreductase subunit 2, chloroplastic [Streptomyces cyaneofuscatus]
MAGLLVFPAANDLLTLFIALEVFSLPLYLLCAVARRKRLMSQEAAVKYFLLGAFSSAFLLFGIALLYGYAGSLSYATIANVVDGSVLEIDPALAGTMGNDALLLIGGALILVGLLKVGAVPFHMWTPDVYQGTDPGDRLHGRRHQGRRVRRAAAPAVRGAPGTPGTCGRCCGRWPSSRCWAHGHGTGARALGPEPLQHPPPEQRGHVDDVELGAAGERPGRGRALLPLRERGARVGRGPRQPGGTGGGHLGGLRPGLVPQQGEDVDGVGRGGSAGLQGRFVFQPSAHGEKVYRE